MMSPQRLRDFRRARWGWAGGFVLFLLTTGAGLVAASYIKDGEFQTPPNAGTACVFLSCLALYGVMARLEIESRWVVVTFRRHDISARADRYGAAIHRTELECVEVAELQGYQGAQVWLLWRAADSRRRSMSLTTKTSAERIRASVSELGYPLKVVGRDGTFELYHSPLLHCRSMPSAQRKHFRLSLGRWARNGALFYLALIVGVASLQQVTRGDAEFPSTSTAGLMLLWFAAAGVFVRLWDEFPSRVMTFGRHSISVHEGERPTATITREELQSVEVVELPDGGGARVLLYPQPSIETPEAAIDVTTRSSFESIIERLSALGYQVKTSDHEF